MTTPQSLAGTIPVTFLVRQYGVKIPRRLTVFGTAAIPVAIRGTCSVTNAAPACPYTTQNHRNADKHPQRQ